MKIGLIYNAPCNILKVIQNPENLAAGAVCFLAMQLAKLGHNVTIFTQGPNLEIFSVRTRHIEVKDKALVLDPALLEKDFAVLIFKDCAPEFALSISKVLPYQPAIYLWTGLDHNNPVNAGLSKTEYLQHFKRVVCVSDWQRFMLFDVLTVPRDKLGVIRYAIAPMFEGLFVDGKEFSEFKPKTLHIAYTATENDGLDILLDAYSDFCANYQDVVLGLFCEIKNPDLRQRLSKNKKIVIHGNLPKLQLANELKKYTIFAGPNIIPATCNIDVLEAMACGLCPVVSDIASNPEYCGDHGKTVLLANLSVNSLDNFVSEMLAVAQLQIHSASKFYDQCFKICLDAVKKDIWRVRAKQWIDMITEDFALK